MIPGPANILSCPYCGSEKEVMSLVSGNTFGGPVWSDTRRDYPMLPEVSPIQQCPHCGKYYFIEQAKSRYSDDRESEMRSFGELGKLSFHKLMEAKQQMEFISLTKMQLWIINHQIFMAYNDSFRRKQEKPLCSPLNEDEYLYRKAITELLEGIDQSNEYNLFHAELLREIGRFQDAKEVLSRHKSDDDQWVVNAMLQHIEDEDTEPFLLLDRGTPIE